MCTLVMNLLCHTYYDNGIVRKSWMIIRLPIAGTCAIKPKYVIFKEIHILPKFG